MGLISRLKHFIFGDSKESAGQEQAPPGSTNGTAAPKPAETASLTSDSYTERAAAWAGHAHLSKDEQLREWEAQMDSWLAKMNSQEQAFLKRLLRQNGQPVDSVTVSANALYRTFMREGAKPRHNPLYKFGE
jgi:hypothetical protein